MEEGYVLQQNATFHFNNILVDTKTDSTVLHITIYVNYSFYQYPESLTLQLQDDNSPFTSYFSFSSGNTTLTISFNDFDPDSAQDQLTIRRGIVNSREVPPGEYQAKHIATLRGRNDVSAHALLQEHTSNSTVIIRVTKSKLCRVKFIIHVCLKVLWLTQKCRFNTPPRV